MTTGSQITYRCRNCLVTRTDDIRKQDPQPCEDCGGDMIAWRNHDRPMNTMWWKR